MGRKSENQISGCYDVIMTSFWHNDVITSGIFIFRFSTHDYRIPHQIFLKHSPIYINKQEIPTEASFLTYDPRLLTNNIL